MRSIGRSDAGQKWRRIFLAVGLAAMAVLGGCETSSSTNQFNHTPPAGQGSLVVNNLTPTDIKVFVDGVSTNEAKAQDVLIEDLALNVHNVVLTQDGGLRSFSSDSVNILEGQLTILTVTISGATTYDVTTRFQAPQ